MIKIDWNLFIKDRIWFSWLWMPNSTMSRRDGLKEGGWVSVKNAGYIYKIVKTGIIS